MFFFKFKILVVDEILRPPSPPFFFEKSKKHQDYINNSKTLINNGTLNITINLNNPEDLDKILKNINK